VAPPTPLQVSMITRGLTRSYADNIVKDASCGNRYLSRQNPGPPDRPQRVLAV
jgi:hypothetical protein